MNLENTPLHFIDTITKYINIKDALLLRKINRNFCDSVNLNKRNIIYNSLKNRFHLKNRSIGCFSRNVQKHFNEKQISCSFEMPFVCSLNFMSSFSAGAREKTMLYAIDLLLKCYSGLTWRMCVIILKKVLTTFFYTKYYVNLDNLYCIQKGGVIDARMFHELGLSYNPLQVEIGINHFYLGTAYVVCKYNKRLKTYMLDGSLTEDINVSIDEGKELSEHWVIIKIDTETESYTNIMESYMKDVMDAEHKKILSNIAGYYRKRYNDSVGTPLTKKELCSIYKIMESSSESDDSDF